MNGRLALLAAAVAGLLSPALSHAATINFGSAQNETADTDVLNTGTIVRAYTFSTGNTPTVNGVAFTPFPSGTDTSTFRNNYGGFGTSGTAPYANLSSSYKSLLAGGYYSDGSAAMITLTGLTVGLQYQVETFVVDSRGCCGAGRNEVVSGDAGGTNVTLDYNSTDTEGGVGQFAIGTFIADATSQVINFAGNSSSQVNGLVLSVPEPASLSLLGVAGMSLLTRRRRRA